MVKKLICLMLNKNRLGVFNLAPKELLDTPELSNRNMDYNYTNIPKRG